VSTTPQTLAAQLACPLLPDDDLNSAFRIGGVKKNEEAAKGCGLLISSLSNRQ